MLKGTCVNIHDSKTDDEGYGCDAYTNKSRCGKHDDLDFKSMKMCCNCGGGGIGTCFPSIYDFKYRISN